MGRAVSQPAETSRQRVGCSALHVQLFTGFLTIIMLLYLLSTFYFSNMEFTLIYGILEFQAYIKTKLVARSLLLTRY